MYLKFQLFIVTFTLYFLNCESSIGGYIGPNDKKKILTVLAKSLIFDKDDFTYSYYAAKGYKLLNEPIVAVLIKDNCAHLKHNYKPDVSADLQFQALSAWSLLGCEGKLHNDGTIKTLQAVLENSQSTTTQIHHVLEALKVIGSSVPNPAKIAQLIQNKLKEDDSLQSLGHALHAASLLGTNGQFALDRVEEIVAQMDEVDGKLLQWEGGLTTTSLLITGLYRIPAKKPLNEEQAEKLAAYLLTRRTVQTPKGALALIEAAATLAVSGVSPVSITVDGPAYVSVDKPELKVLVSDILGRPLKTPLVPVVQSATRISDGVVVLSKQPLSPGSTQTEFILKLKVEPGQYRIALTAGSHSTNIIARVLGTIKINSLEIGLSDSDGSTALSLTKLQHPEKLSKSLQADSSQRLVVKFSLSQKVHQAFLQLTSKASIVFVAEETNSNLYKIDVDLASELAHSGTFKMELILGDFTINNPIVWELGNLEMSLLNVPEVSSKPTRGPKPEIKHMFRPAEKRPPEAVSLLFTALTLSPLLLLLGLWLKLGINFGNFSVLAVPFHLGFGGILGLFTLFWLKLDMFTTCAWLIPIGGFTFLAAQKLLSSIAKHKK